MKHLWFRFKLIVIVIIAFIIISMIFGSNSKKIVMKKEMQISMDVELYHLSKEEIKSIEKWCVAKNLMCVVNCDIVRIWSLTENDYQSLKTTLKMIRL